MMRSRALHGASYTRMASMGVLWFHRGDDGHVQCSDARIEPANIKDTVGVKRLFQLAVITLERC